MAAAFDSVASNFGYPPNGISFNHSLGSGSGSDRIVMVGIETVGGNGNTIPSCTYNGVSMSLLSQVSETYFSRETWVRVYYLMDSSLPASQGAYGVSVSFSGGAYYGIVSAISYEGVNQSVPPYALSSDSLGLNGEYSTSISVASDSGLLVDFGGAEASGNGITQQTPSSGQTERSDTLDVEIDLVISEKVYSSSGSNSMGQTPDSLYEGYGHIVVELEDAGGSPSGEISLLGSQGFAASGTSVSGSYTCHSGSNRKLLVAAGAEYIGSGIDTNSVTYNGVNLTKIVEEDHSTPYNNIAWFYLDDTNFPSTSGAYTLQVNFSQAANPGHLMVIEIQGAEQGSVSGYNDSEGSNTASLNTTITVQKGLSWIIGAAITGSVNTFTAQSGQTELVDQTGGGGGCSACLGYEEIPIAGASNMQWGTSSTANRILQIVLAIPPADTDLLNAVFMGSNF